MADSPYKDPAVHSSDTSMTGYDKNISTTSKSAYNDEFMSESETKVDTTNIDGRE